MEPPTPATPEPVSNNPVDDIRDLDVHEMKRMFEPSAQREVVAGFDA